MSPKMLPRLLQSRTLGSASTGARSGLAITLALSLSGGVFGCGAADGDPELLPRPKVLTPTTRTAQDVVIEAAAPPACTLPVVDPPPAPPGTPDAAGYISGPPRECTGPDLTTKCVYGTPAPSTGVLLDFTSYATSGMWGTASVGQITGGTSLYSGTGTASDAITQEMVEGRLQIAATIPAGGYSGIVFWFGPCVNASAFSGVQFAATGQLGGASMIVKAQTSPDYPIDAANNKGKCRYKVEADRFTECQQPVVTVTALPAAGPLTLPWAMFTGGIPVPSIDPAQLLGFELQFSCTAPPSGSSSCALDLDLGSISFAPM